MNNFVASTWLLCEKKSFRRYLSFCTKTGNAMCVAWFRSAVCQVPGVGCGTNRAGLF